MSMKEAYEQKLQAQLDEWSAEIDKLKAKADGAEALSLIHISEPTRQVLVSRMPSSA